MNTERYTPDRLLLEFGIQHPPVDVFGIARGIGAALYFVNSPNWDGAVDSKETGEARIFVNAGHHVVRQRFTVAHEIGHLVLHEPGQAFRDTFSSQGVNIGEVQANNFAAGLLMPSWMVNALASGRHLYELATIFNVSADAMRYRLQNMGYSVA